MRYPSLEAAALALLMASSIVMEQFTSPWGLTICACAIAEKQPPVKRTAATPTDTRSRDILFIGFASFKIGNPFINRTNRGWKILHAALFCRGIRRSTWNDRGRPGQVGRDCPRVFQAETPPRRRHGPTAPHSASRQRHGPAEPPQRPTPAARPRRAPTALRPVRRRHGPTAPRAPAPVPGAAPFFPEKRSFSCGGRPNGVY